VHQRVQGYEVLFRSDLENAFLKVSQYATELDLDEGVIPDSYIEAAKWVSDFAVTE
jgi:hypothetical protein